MNKLYASILAAALFAIPYQAMAEEDLTVEFDFTQPETLTPPVATPAQKESVELDGRTFTEGDVEISFYATGGGNTPVRLYGSYDAGCNLRVYDGDSFEVSVTNPKYALSKIVYDTALSGTTADVDLVADTGYYEWLENTWTADDTATDEVTFYSNMQSRISVMRVTLVKASKTGVTSVAAEESSEIWYTIDGIKVDSPKAPGLYIRSGRKLIIK